MIFEVFSYLNNSMILCFPDSSTGRVKWEHLLWHNFQFMLFKFPSSTFSLNLILEWKTRFQSIHVRWHNQQQTSWQRRKSSSWMQGNNSVTKYEIWLTSKRFLDLSSLVWWEAGVIQKMASRQIFWKLLITKCRKFSENSIIQRSKKSQCSFCQELEFLLYGGCKLFYIYKTSWSARLLKTDNG